MKRLAVVLAFVVILPWHTAGATDATGTIPPELQVYNAQSAAAPLGVISRVPAETDGGLIYAQTNVDIGKARGAAAAATLGPLGDAFVLTSVPINGFSIPAQVTAQYPPSAFAPTEANASTNLGVGPATLATFHAVAKDPTAASADATGAAADLAGLVHVGGGTSHSTSSVAPDGTVSTQAVSSLTGITIGPAAAPLVSIAGMTATASVRVPLGGKPVTAVKMQMVGALIAGVPVDITQTGINIAGALPVPATGIATINAALAALAAQGLVLQVVPVVNSIGDVGASVFGAALEIGYVAPAAIVAHLPTNIGTNETILLGEVAATATGRKRVPLSLSSGPSLPSVLPPVAAAAPATAPAPVSSPPVPSVSPVALAPTAPLPVVPTFSLPHRIRNATAQKFLVGYRWFLITAIVMAGVYLLARRSLTGGSHG